LRWAKRTAAVPITDEPQGKRGSGKGNAGQSEQGEIGTFFHSTGCRHCNNTGRFGDVAIFDVFRADHDSPDLFRQPSQLPMESYVLHLASLGRLALENFLQFESEQMHRIYHLYAASEKALAEANAKSQRELMQLEAANRVLRQRTEALVSIQDIGQALTTSASLEDFANRICSRARDLCGADRSLLYIRLPDDLVEVLAFTGWDPEIVQRRLHPAGGPCPA
jgi:hypothetical protein